MTFWTLEKCIPFKLEETLPEYTDIQTNMDLESLFGGSSRGGQLLVYPRPKTGPPLFGEGRPLRPSAQLREGRTWSGEGGRGHPPSQPDQPNQPWRSVG